MSYPIPGSWDYLGTGHIYKYTANYPGLGYGAVYMPACGKGMPNLGKGSTLHNL